MRERVRVDAHSKRTKIMYMYFSLVVYSELENIQIVNFTVCTSLEY